LDGFNYIDLVAQTGSDATLSFSDSANALQSRIFIDNTAKRLTIQSDTGLTINSTGATTTDFSAGVVENLKTLTLTSTVFSAWSAVSSYPDGAEVEYDNANWVGQFAGNRGNIPSATLQNWVSGDGYDVGNVRYYATNNKAYLCNTAVTIGTVTPPPSDAKWTEFQVGNNGEDVWFPFTAPVISTIVGDRVSIMEIGNITCVGDVGSYLEITADPEDNANGLIQSAGSVAISGNTGVQVASTTGDIGIISFVGGIQLNATDPTNGAIAINGNTLVGLSASVGNIVLEAQADVNIETTTGSTNITSGGEISLEATGGNIRIHSTTGDLALTSQLATTIDASTTIALTSVSNVSLTSSNDAISLNANAGISLFAGTGQNVAIENNVIFDEEGDKITGKASGLTLENVVAITTPTAGGNITINTYYPPLRIYKNATIGSAVSRAANTAEVQLYPQAMTLKANTQYLLNMSYAGLTENVSTATPNNNWYIIYRVHQGTTPLTTANLWGLAQLFNNTAQAGGVSVSFMTTTAGTYTGRFYIRNQNATVALTIANISATVIEVF